MALKIAPFKATLAPRDGAAWQVFMIENNSPEPAAVQVSVTSWDVAPDGTETNRNAEDDFSVFPAQLVLKPHERRAVRVQWLGTQPLEAEKPYRVVAEQIPIRLKDTPEAASALRFMLRFRAALYVTPDKSASDVAVESVSSASGGKARVTLVNRGTRHTILRNPVLTLAAATGDITLSGPDLQMIEGENIHAGAARFFDIHLPSGAGEGNIPASLSYDPAF